MKDCRNCGMRSQDVCMRSGRTWRETRYDWADKGHCDGDFSGWVPMELKMSWWERVWSWFK